MKIEFARVVVSPDVIIVKFVISYLVTSCDLISSCSNYHVTSCDVIVASRSAHSEDIFYEVQEIGVVGRIQRVRERVQNG